MWADAQRDGRPAEYRWRPLFNATNFGWCTLLEYRAVTLPRSETHWNYLGCPKLPDRSKPKVGRCASYYGDIWRRYCSPIKLYDGAQMAIFCVLYFHKKNRGGRKFLLLGKCCNRHDGSEKDILTRAGKANSVFGWLENIWKNKRLGIKTKMRLYEALVLSTLRYRAEHESCEYETVGGCTPQVATQASGCHMERWNQERWDKTGNRNGDNGSHPQ